MEPFTMMLGYGLVNSLSQLVVRPIADKISAPGRQAEMLMQMQTKHKLDLEAVRLNKQIELDNQIDIQSYCHKFRLQEAQSQFERQLQMWQIGKYDEKMWPLLTPFDHPSLRPRQMLDGRTPLNVFLASTAPHTPFAEMIQPDLKIRMSTFLQTSYANDPNQEHPCVCRIGDWKAGFQDAAFINALWFGMQGIPSIVVNPMQAQFGEKLDLTVSMWGLGEYGSTPKMQNVLTGDFGIAIGRIKRNKTEEWVNCGLPISTPEMQHNVKLLEQEKNMIANGYGQHVSKLYVQYKLPKEIQNDVITAFSSEYNHVISCITGMYADIYHLIEYGAQPYMPIAINLYNRQNGQSFQIPDLAVEHYRKALTTMVCTNYLQEKLPSAYMGVAQSLSYVPDNSIEIFREGVGLWANKKTELKKEVPIPETLDDCLRLLYDKAGDNDKSYLEQAKNVLITINEKDAAKQLEKLEKKISVVIGVSERYNKKETEWNVINKLFFTEQYFYSWSQENRVSAQSNNAKYAVLLFRNEYFVSFFVDEKFKFVSYNNGQGGVCILTERYCIPDEVFGDNLILYELQTGAVINNKYTIMEKKEFDSFERLGKQLDVLINNLGRIPNAKRVNRQDEQKGDIPSNGKDFSQQLTDLFLSNNFISLESEQINIVCFDAVREWITSKLPVQFACKAHVLKTQYKSNMMICIFFADAEGNALLGNDYPMKRVICNNCDSDMDAFLNGLVIGTIKLD